MYFSKTLFRPTRGFVFAHLIAILYLLMIPYAVEKQGDFVHFWVAGRAFLQAGPAGIYDSQLHREILSATGLPLSTYWSPANAAVGAFFYPPFTILWYAPLAYFSLPTALAAQALLTWGLVIACGLLLAELSGKTIARSWAIALLFLTPPVFYNFALGQNGVLTLTIILGALWWERRGYHRRAGFVLAVLVYKPNWLLASCWYPLIRRTPQMLVGISAGLILVALATWWIVGLAPLLTYLAILPALGNLQNIPGYSFGTQFSILAAYRSIFTEQTFALVAFCFSALAAVLLVTRVLRKGNEERLPPALRAAIPLLCISLINPHLHHHDLTLLYAAGVLIVGYGTSRLYNNAGVRPI